MELTILERLKLLEALPPQGDLLTLKIIRKLRESLSFSEEELRFIGATYEYACPILDDNGVHCDSKGFFQDAPKCPIHNIEMVRTGQMNLWLSLEVQMMTKEVHMGVQALSIASQAIKRLNDNGQLTEAHISLYEKFFPPGEGQ